MTMNGRHSRRGHRGLVTVELALSTLAVLIMLAMVSWALFLVMVQMACIDTASAVARQAARGDRKGVAAAEATAPADAVVHVDRRGDRVIVGVRARVVPPGGAFPPVTVRASAEAVVEPGVTR
ncbi:MAG: TadE family type IV pilus minor pilin [Propionibacteriaceae bacterium]